MARRFTSYPEPRTVERAKRSLSGKDIDEAFEVIEQQIEQVISGVYVFKGTVASYDDLPTEGMKNGWVYNTTDTGKNYAWDADLNAWDDLGGSAKFAVENITALTNAKCNIIHCGDLVVENNQGILKTYVVNYKADTKLELTYTNYEQVISVVYNKSQTTWSYTQTNVYTLNKSRVVANPTLEGTENNLEGLEIDGVKYKAGGGELYAHLVSVYLQGYTNSMRLIIYLQSNTQLTAYDVLHNNGAYNKYKYFLVSDKILYDDTAKKSYVIANLDYYSGNTLQVYLNDIVNQTSSWNQAQPFTFYDTVIKIF